MAQWSENAKKVLAERYLIKDKTGNLVETPDKMLERVARYISSAEPDYLKEEYYSKFLGIMDSLEFLPNSPTLINAGRKNPQLSACFVLPIYDSLDSIFEMVKQSALIHKSGGGTGFSFSSLRPAGAVVASTHGVASGPISFMSVFNAVTEVVKQGGVRRGANMGILNYSHPDIMEFIDCKQDKKSFSNFNISVGTNGGFFDKVLNDELIQLRFRGFPYKGQIKARDIFNKLCHNAWETGEPGILFFDTINKFNPTPWLGNIWASNPCSEAPLLPFESCNLGSINLHKLVEGGKFDFERLISLVKLATRFLDDTIDVNNFPRIQIARATKLTRKVGLGVMGWADVLGGLKIAYDSEAAFKLAEKIMANIKRTSYQTSGELALEKGTPQKRLKRRNTCLMAIAPTGTLSLLANCLGGETAIDTLEGKIPVKELVGKEPFLYSYNTTKREVVIQRARAIWSRGRQETYRITFDTGDILETTQDHRIMLLNSSYKNVSQLQVGDRVKAFYKWADKNKHFMIRASDTVARKQSWLCFELFNNQHIAQGKLGRYPWLIHHKDGNSFNDSPENLVKMTNREHALLHKPFLATLSSEVRKKISITQKKKFEDVAYKLQIAAATKKGMWSEEGRKNLLGGIEKRRSYKGNLNPAYKKEIDVWVVTNEKKHFCLCGCGKFVSIKRRHHYSGIPQYIRGHKKTTIKNHMVIKIEKMGVQEVYDIDMGEGHPNFSANGVFVHNCSSGIEPHFARAYTKNVINGITLNLGTEYKVKTAMEISPENHVRTLASFQKYTDQGVSKTINLPQEAIVEDIKKVMILAHKLGAKGLTVYRQGSRDEAPLQELSECSDEKCLV